MKVLHTIFGMSTANGGPTTCTFTLVKSLRKELEVSILTFSPPKGEELISEDNFICVVNTPKEKRFGYSYSFNKEISQRSPDVLHINGLWHYSSFASSKFAKKRNIPVVYSPHGMLYPEALKHSSYLKAIALKIYQRKHLADAAVLHATCMQEKQHLRNLGLKNPIAVIPNPIELNEFSSNQTQHNKVRRIGFIGRLDPIKNIEHLIRAWSKTGGQKEGWELVIIGSGNEKYTESLRFLAEDLSLSNIKFTGFLKGKEKKEVLNSLSYLVLPSKSENFGMVVAEALLQEIPVIATKGTPWEELNSHRAGWWIDEGVASLSKALLEAIDLSESERLEMGKNGRELVIQNYSVESVVEKMTCLYKWLLNQEKQPHFVYLNENAD